MCILQAHADSYIAFVLSTCSLSALISHCFGILPHIRLLLKGWLSLQAEYCQPSQLVHLQYLKMGVQSFHLVDGAPVQDQLFKTVVQLVEGSSPELKSSTGGSCMIHTLRICCRK